MAGKREYYVVHSKDASGLFLDIIEPVKDTKAGQRWIAKQGEDGKDYAVIAMTTDVLHVTIENVEKRIVTVQRPLMKKEA